MADSFSSDNKIFVINKTRNKTICIFLRIGRQMGVTKPHRLHFYRPQTKFAKVMFLHVSVILSTGGGSASVHAGIPAPLGADIPPGTVHAGRCGQRAGGMHPTGMQSCIV